MPIHKKANLKRNLKNGKNGMIGFGKLHFQHSDQNIGVLIKTHDNRENIGIAPVPHQH